MTKIEEDTKETVEDIEEEEEEARLQRDFTQRSRSSERYVSNTQSSTDAASRMDERIQAKIRGAPAASTPGAVRSNAPISSKAARKSAAASSVGSVASKDLHASTLKASIRGSVVSREEKTRLADERVKNSVRASVQSAPPVTLNSASNNMAPLYPIPDNDSTKADEQEVQEVIQSSDAFTNRGNPVIYDGEQSALVSPDVEHFSSNPYDVEDQPQQIDQHDGTALEAFVPTNTSVIDATAVAVMLDEDEELDKAKIQFKKKAAIATICILAVCIIIIVPISLKYFRTTEEKIVVNIIPTANPTSMPSIMPSLSPTKLTYPEAVKSMDDYIQTKVPGFLKQSTTVEEYTKQYTIPGTIQSKALKWMIYDDKIARDINDTRWRQRLILAILYFAMTENQEWVQCGKEQEACNLEEGVQPWLSATDECAWFGVLCRTDKKILKLNKVSSVGANGQFPAEVGLLFESLTEITWQRDNVYGSIPDAWGLLTSLTAFNVARTNLTGPWPKSLFDKTPLLTTMYIHKNKLSGSISTSIGQLKNLKKFSIYGNNFNGTLPSEIGLLSSLDEFKIDNNSFDGKIPEEFAKLSLLRSLGLSNNSFFGTFPEEFYDLDQLHYFDISSNDFTGPLSSKVGLMGRQVNQVKRFLFSNNQFDGKIPNEFSEIQLLDTLDLANNSFTGTVADEICMKTGIVFDQLEALSVDCDKVSCKCCKPSCFPSNLIDQLVNKPDGIEEEKKANHWIYWNAKDTTWTGTGRTVQNEAISWFFYNQVDWSSFKHPIQRVVLATLYYATKGENWSNKNFLTTDNECNWFGITCDNEGVVVKINLAFNNLQGFIPRELGLLTLLNTLNVTNNNIAEPVPSNLENIISV